MSAFFHLVFVLGFLSRSNLLTMAMAMTENGQLLTVADCFGGENAQALGRWENLETCNDQGL